MARPGSTGASSPAAVAGAGAKADAAIFVGPPPHAPPPHPKHDPTDAGRRTLHALADAPRVNGWIYQAIRASVRGDVLEIGSGIGNLSRFILADARRAVLTDVDAQHLAALRRAWAGDPRVEVMSLDVEQPPPAALAGTGTEPGRRFDAVVAVNVLEHVRRDGDAVERLASLLRPGGDLVVYVPACPWAFGSLDVALGHHRRYTAASLRDVLGGAGLLVSPPRYMNRLGLVGWLASGKVLRRQALSARAVAAFERLVGLARGLDVVLGPSPPGLGLVATARKLG